MSMSRWGRWHLRTLAAVIALGVIVAAGGTADASIHGSAKSAAAKSPIIIAGICDYTGPDPSPQPCQMSQDYFSWLNSRGGINGHKVEYTAMDEADSATTAAQDGARAVESLHVDAIVGDYSQFACTVNAELYAQNDVYDLGGPESDVGCWKSPYIRPMNGGPQVTGAIGIYYFIHYRGFKRICVLENSSTPASLADGINVINVMKRVTGDQDIYSIPYAAGTPITPVASAAVADNCQGFLAPTDEPDGEELWRALDTLGATKKMVVMGEVVYSNEPQQLGSIGNSPNDIVEGAIVPYWHDNSKALQEYHFLLKKYDMVAGSFNEYGFLSDLLFTQLVSAIKGPINRQTIGNALKNMKNANGYGMEANNISWGSVDTSVRIFVDHNNSWTEPKHVWYTFVGATPAEMKSIETGVPIS